MNIRFCKHILLSWACCYAFGGYRGQLEKIHCKLQEAYGKARVATGLVHNIYSYWLCTNEQVDVTLDTVYAGFIGFKSQLGHWLSWMKFFVVFLSQDKCQGHQFPSPYPFISRDHHSISWCYMIFAVEVPLLKATYFVNVCPSWTLTH